MSDTHEDLGMYKVHLGYMRGAVLGVDMYRWVYGRR